MASDLRKYTHGVRFALAALCGGTCYWPGCGEPVVRFVDDDPISNLQIAHIAGATPGGTALNFQDVCPLSGDSTGRSLSCM
jgi:hypothetical protein